MENITNQHQNESENELSELNLAFLNASYEGRLPEIQEMIRTGAVSMNVKDPMDGAGPLHLASAGGHLDIVQYFVEQLHVDINQLTNDGATPLCLAVSDGMIEITRYFVHLGADPGHCLSDGATPLILACIQGHLNLVKYLVEDCQVDPRAATKIGESPVFLAGQEGHVDIVRYLLDEGGANVNQERNDGIAPLNNACWAGHLPVVELLLSQGALVNGRDFNGQTALHVVSEKGFERIAKALLNAGAEVDAKDNAGSTPLCVAAAKGRSPLVRLLLAHGACLGESGWNGNTPLHLASWGSHLHVLETIFDEQRMADPSGTASALPLLLNCQNYFGYTPLHLAVLKENFIVAEYFLNEHSPDICLHNCKGETILHTALHHIREGNSSPAKSASALAFVAFLLSQVQKPWANAIPDLLARPNTEGITPCHIIRHRNTDVQHPELLWGLVEANFLGALTSPILTETKSDDIIIDTRPPGAAFVEQASQVIPGLCLERLQLISKETIFKAGHIPSFGECKEKNWHWKASDTHARDKILFVSHAWSSTIEVDSCNRKYLILQRFLNSAEGLDVRWVYIDYSCTTQEKSSDLYQIHRLNVLTALWRATDFLIIPTFIEIPCLFKANQVLHATNLQNYVHQPWCLLETLSAMLTSSRVFCSFQVGGSFACRMFDRPEGGSSSLGFHQAYLDVWDRFMTQSREDMLEADRISLRAAWKVVEPCRLLGLLISLAKKTARGEAMDLLRAVVTLSLTKIDVEQNEDLSEIWDKLGAAPVEEEKLIALNLLLFMALYSMNILSLSQNLDC